MCTDYIPKNYRGSAFAVVISGNRVTIPKWLMKKLKLEEGSSIEIIVENHGAYFKDQDVRKFIEDHKEQ